MRQSTPCHHLAQLYLTTGPLCQVQLPSTEDYWKQSPVYHYSPIADKISRRRYREISRYLHFVDNSTLASPGSPEYDILGKVRPLLDHMQSHCAALYNPSNQLAIDEAMIKFQGRSSLKQYMPQKPIKRGINRQHKWIYFPTGSLHRQERACGTWLRCSSCEGFVL